MGIFDFLRKPAASVPATLKLRCLKSDGSLAADLTPNEFGYNSLRWAFDIAVGVFDPLVSGELSKKGLVSPEAVQPFNGVRQLYLAQAMGIVCAGYNFYLPPLLVGELVLQRGELEALSGEIQGGVMDGAKTWYSLKDEPHRQAEYDSFLGALSESKTWYVQEWGPAFLEGRDTPNKWATMLNTRHTKEKTAWQLSTADLYAITVGTALDPVEFLHASRQFHQLIRS